MTSKIVDKMIKIFLSLIGWKLIFDVVKTTPKVTGISFFKLTA